MGDADGAASVSVIAVFAHAWVEGSHPATITSEPTLPWVELSAELEPLSVRFCSNDILLEPSCLLGRSLVDGVNVTLRFLNQLCYTAACKIIAI